MSRFHNSLRNSTVTMAGQIINLFVGFAVRLFFIRILGQDYLGVNGVMESMLTLLSVTELGIGTSITFALYLPIDQDDKPHIGRLMAFYRRTYYIIGFITLGAGLVLIPFMNFFTKGANGVPNILLIYLIFLLDTVIGYFFSYKQTLINAYQNYYVTSLSQDAFGLLKHLLQILCLIWFRSYFGYLIISLVTKLASNILLAKYCDRHYPFVKEYRKEKLSPEDKELMKKSVVSLIYQRAGASLVTGTDNLMVSWVSIAGLGIYSNYSLVVSTVNKLIYNVSRSIMGSLGNLLVQPDEEHKYKVYEEFVFANFCIYGIIGVGLAGCLERFIRIYAGDDWLLPTYITLCVTMNFVLNGLRQPNVMIIESGGYFNHMRPKAVAEVIVNLIVSLLFLVTFDMGIFGVLLGTTVSMVSVCIWWEALCVHKYAFHHSVWTFAWKYVRYLVLETAACFAARFVCDRIPLQGILGFLVCGCVSVAIGGIFFLLVLGPTGECRRFAARFLDKFRKKTGASDSDV